MRYLLVLVLLGLIWWNGCTDPDHATKLLKQQGFTSVQITGYDLFACSKDDWYHTGFRAIARDNTAVKGTVCKGLLFKSATIRFD